MTILNIIKYRFVFLYYHMFRLRMNLYFSEISWRRFIHIPKILINSITVFLSCSKTKANHLHIVHWETSTWLAPDNTCSKTDSGFCLPAANDFFPKFLLEVGRCSNHLINLGCGLVIHVTEKQHVFIVCLSASTVHGSAHRYSKERKFMKYLNERSHK